MARGNQLDRQWRLLQLIDRPAGVTVEDAARDLGCHVRTIWRDVDVLAPLNLAEVLALLMSRDLLAAAGASVLGPDLASAMDKIHGLLSPDALRLLDTLREAVGVRAAAAPW